MNEATQSPRERAHELIRQALKTGIRGELRDVLQHAERLSSFAASAQATSPTDMEYRNLKMGDKLMDKARAGLLMRAGKRSGKVWIFRYADPVTTKQREFQFGAYPAMTVADARSKWEELRAIRNEGKDPSAVVIAQKAEVLTVAGLVDKYIELYAMKVNADWKKTKSLLDRYLLPTYGDLAAVDFDHKAAAELLAKIYGAGTPRQAEKLRSALSVMFRVATGRTRKIETLSGTWLPPSHPNPVESVMLPKHTAQNYNPTHAELSRYVTGLRGMPHYGDVLLFQMLTMSRITETCELPWSEIDMENGIWTLAATRAKNSREHKVMLSPQAMAILETRQATSAGKHVFPARRNPNKAMASKQAQDALKAARTPLDLPDGFTSHSLRHAALTWVAENGGGQDIRDRLSNHVNGNTVDAVYNKAALNGPASDWWKRWADYVDQLGTGNVVHMIEKKSGA